MELIEKILKFNQKFIIDKDILSTQYDFTCSQHPNLELAIVTCMDTRLITLLEDAMNIKRGDAKIIKTTGAYISSELDNVVKSLLICIYELGVKEIFIIGHYDCGMEKTSSEHLIQQMLSRGIQPTEINKIKEELIRWADTFTTPTENVIQSVKLLRKNPFIPKDIHIHGFMFQLNTGELTLVSNKTK